MPRTRKQARTEEHGESSRTRRPTRRRDPTPPPSSSSEEAEAELSFEDTPSSEDVSTDPENSSSEDIMEGGEEELPFDHFRFRNQRRQMEFERYWSRRPVLCERGIRLTDFAALREIIVRRGWTRAMTFRASADPVLVREFFANVKVYAPDEGERQILSRARGRRLRFKASTFATFLDIPHVDNPGYPFPEDTRPSRDTLAATLSAQTQTSWGFVPQFPKRQLSPFYRALHELSCSQIFPLVHDDLVSVERAALLYAIATGVPIDLASVIFDTIIQRADNLTARSVLPFGGLITGVLEQFGVEIMDTARTVVPSVMISESTGARRTAQLRLRDPPPSSSGASTSTAPPVVTPPPRPPVYVPQRNIVLGMDARLRHVEAEIPHIRGSLAGIESEQAAQRRLLESQGVTLDSILAALRAMDPNYHPPTDFDRPPSP